MIDFPTLCAGRESTRTWYLVRRVLHTPVSSIIPTRKGIRALLAMFAKIVDETTRYTQGMSVLEVKRRRLEWSCRRQVWLYLVPRALETVDRRL